MKLDEKSLKIGAIALLGAVLIRLCIPFLPQDMHMASLLFFLESGYWAEPSEPHQEELPSAQAPEVLPDAVAVFAPQQAEEIRFHNPAGHTFSAEALLLRELNWNLRGDRPKVLILHTHTTESYENKEGYEALPNYRTLDPSYNMLAVGDRLAEKLEQAGIGVLHDRTIHDYPSYNGAYTSSKASIKAYLEEYPDICLVLDLHRDAYEDSSGKQLGYTTTYEDEKIAQLMLVVSAFDANEKDPKWQENMALALKLQAKLQLYCPGVARPIAVRTTNYNQALGPRTLLVEMGAAGNTQQEALGATDLLAQSIIDLALGAKSKDLV